MKRLPIVVMFALTGSILAFRSIENITVNNNPPGKYEKIMKLVGEMMSQAHFSPQDINDAFSKKVFTKFISDLDPEKNMFLKADMDALKKKYESKVDDELKGTDVDVPFGVGKIFN